MHQHFQHTLFPSREWWGAGSAATFCLQFVLWQNWVIHNVYFVKLNKGCPLIAPQNKMRIVKWRRIKWLLLGLSTPTVHLLCKGKLYFSCCSAAPTWWFMLPVFLLLIVYRECLNLDWIPSHSLSRWIALREIKPQSVWAVPFTESSQLLIQNYWKSFLRSWPRLDSDCVGDFVCISMWGQILPWLQLLFLKPLIKAELVLCWNWTVCAKASVFDTEVSFIMILAMGISRKILHV